MLARPSVVLYRASVDQDFKEREKRDLVCNALDAFDRLTLHAPNSERELAQILRAFKCRFIRVWEIAADLLSRLAAKYEVAQQAFVTLLCDQKAEIRRRVLTPVAIGCVSKEFAARLIRLGLRDRSYEVRGFAAEAACEFELTGLVPELQAALIVEKHPRARQCLEFAVALLRDGYFLQRDNAKLTNVWVKRARGRGDISVPITDDDLNTGRLEAILEYARSRP